MLTRLMFAFVLAFVLPGVGFAQDVPPVVVEENPGRAECAQPRDGTLLHRGKHWMWA